MAPKGANFWLWFSGYKHFAPTERGQIQRPKTQNQGPSLIKIPDQHDVASLDPSGRD